MHLALLSWAVALIGYYALEQPGGLPGRLIDILSPSATRITICRGLIISGLLGAIGTFAAIAQPLWLVLPLFLVLIRAYLRSGEDSERTE